MAPYQYKPLSGNDFRLLHLAPGKWDDMIRLVFSQVGLAASPVKPDARLSLDELRATMPDAWSVYETMNSRYIFERDDEMTSWIHPRPDFDQSLYSGYPPTPLATSEFEALSYVWGPQDGQAEVSVVHSTHDTPYELGRIRIGKNLATALRYLRMDNDWRTLWIDALCINQKDLRERDQQVPRIAQIYNLAFRVIAWLGEEAEDSKHALETLNHLGQQVQFLQDNCRVRSPDAGEHEAYWYKAKVDLPYQEDTWRALTGLFQREWFDRLWVWQEIQLANHRAVAQCGKDQIFWSALRDAARCLLAKSQLPSQDLTTALKRHRRLFINLRQRTAAALLHYMKIRKCADPRDKVYGLLGLAPPRFAANIRPNYSSSVSEVYKQALLVYLEQTRRLDLLEYCNLSSPDVDTPTWVPDWRCKDVCVPAFSLAVGISAAEAEFCPPCTLRVIGLSFGPLRTISDPAPSEIVQLVKHIRRWRSAITDNGAYPKGESVLDAFIATIQLGRIRERYHNNAIPTLEEARTMLEIITAAPIDDEFDENGFRHHPSYNQFIGALIGYKFAMSASGHFGIVTADTELGKAPCLPTGQRIYAYAVERRSRMHLLGLLCSHHSPRNDIRQVQNCWQRPHPRPSRRRGSTRSVPKGLENTILD